MHDSAKLGLAGGIDGVGRTASESRLHPSRLQYRPVPERSRAATLWTATERSYSSLRPTGSEARSVGAVIKWLGGS